MPIVMLFLSVYLSLGFWQSQGEGAWLEAVEWSGWSRSFTQGPLPHTPLFLAGSVISFISCMHSGHWNRTKSAAKSFPNRITFTLLTYRATSSNPPPPLFFTLLSKKTCVNFRGFKTKNMFVRWQVKKKQQNN